MDCPVSLLLSVGFSDLATTPPLSGFAVGLPLTSSDIQVPLVGVGLSASGKVRTGSFSTAGFRILAENIPSALGNVYIHCKNLTTGESKGPLTLSSSTAYGDFTVGFSASVNVNEPLVLLIHSDNPGVLPSIVWTLY